MLPSSIGLFSISEFAGRARNPATLTQSPPGAAGLRGPSWVSPGAVRGLTPPDPSSGIRVVSANYRAALRRRRGPGTLPGGRAGRPWLRRASARRQQHVAALPRREMLSCLTPSARARWTCVRSRARRRSRKIISSAISRAAPRSTLSRRLSAGLRRWVWIWTAVDCCNTCCYMTMFEWDEDKNTGRPRKHGIAFEDVLPCSQSRR